MSQTVNLSEKVINKIDAWAKKFNVKADELMPVYLKNAQANNNDEVKALRATVVELTEEYGSLLSNAPYFYAYLLEDNGPNDIFELMRGKSKRLAESDKPEERAMAENDGYVDINGTPLDYRKTVFGKPNENYGNPLTGHSYQRSMLAIISADENFTSPIVADVTAEGEFAKNLPVMEPFEFYKFRANQNPKYPSKLRLSVGTKFSTVDVKTTVAEIANKFKSVDFNNLEEEYIENFAGKKRTSYLSVVRGYVAALSLNPIMNNRVFILMEDDSDIQLRCKINEKVPVTFKKLDSLLGFARLFTGKDGKVGAQVRSYIVIE